MLYSSHPLKSMICIKYHWHRLASSNHLIKSYSRAASQGQEFKTTRTFLQESRTGRTIVPSRLWGRRQSRFRTCVFLLLRILHRRMPGYLQNIRKNTSHRTNPAAWLSSFRIHHSVHGAPNAIKAGALAMLLVVECGSRIRRRSRYKLSTYRQNQRNILFFSSSGLREEFIF